MHHSIEIQNLSFSYPDGHEALNDVSLMIGPGEKAAIVGPNGAGKSTLLLHLNGILDGSGIVEISGLEVNNNNISRIRGMVGLVFQNPEDQLFSPTVFDDVAYGPIYQGLPAKEVDQRVEDALEAVAMQAYTDRVSHHLSVGEKKRISIATVLSMDPEVLILDEPTAGMDPRARRSLISLLGDLPHTILASTHDMAFVLELFPRMIVMDDGRVVADGPTRSLLQDRVFLEAHGLEQPLGFGA